MNEAIPAVFDLDTYSYELPDELIAQEPLSERDASRLLNVEASGELEDAFIKEVGKFFRPGDVLVLNNSRVMPMRIFGNKESNDLDGTQANIKGGKVEIMINSITEDGIAEALIKSSRPIKAPSRICIDAEKSVYLEVVDIQQRGENKLYQLKSGNDKSMQELCADYGVMPLPPYIKRSATAADSERYQTVYAKESGSAAAPTAGLHFSEGLLAKLKQQGMSICELTLHVGIGTFSPIRSRDIREHKMHPEYCSMSAELCAELNKARAAGHRIIAGGTTSLRTLESFWNRDLSCFKAGAMATDLFIYPNKNGDATKIINSADMLITNFHQPCSSLLLLVCAFAGYDKVMAAYKHAIEQKYRFFSYGDACLFYSSTS